MKNLLEELNRIKELMVYEKGNIINEVSTSSRINVQNQSSSLLRIRRAKLFHQ